MPFKKTPPLYFSWKGMFRNCRANSYYEGVQVCKEWQVYSEYENWCLSNGWKTGMRIVRIDKRKDFSPENCAIVSVAKANDMRSCVKRTKEGLSTTDLSLNRGGTSKYERNRAARRIFEYGWEVGDAFTLPCQKPRKAKNA